MPQTLKEVIQKAQLKFDLEVRNVIAARPDLPYRDIGKVFGVSYDVVQRVAKDFGLMRKTGPKSGSLKMTQKESV